MRSFLIKVLVVALVAVVSISNYSTNAISTDAEAERSEYNKRSVVIDWLYWIYVFFYT
jgi:hypothetical protein